MRCSCARDDGRGWLPCPFLTFPRDLKRRRNASGYTCEANGEWRIANRVRALLAIRHSLVANLLLLAGDRLGRALARARIGVGALAAHRQATAMTQAAIAAEVHQPLDVDAGLAAKVALHNIVAVDDFADLQHFRIAQLADTAILGNLDLLDDVGRNLRTDAMDVLERDQDALVGRDVDAGNTGHGLLSCRRSLSQGGGYKFLLSRAAGVRKREHDALPSASSGRGIV